MIIIGLRKLSPFLIVIHLNSVHNKKLPLPLIANIMDWIFSVPT